MTTNELIEKNANLVKWCVHVIGPDDVHAAPNHHAAVVGARERNRALFDRLPDKLDEILCFAYASPWNGTDDLHAESLKGWSEFCGLPSVETKD